MKRACKMAAGLLLAAAVLRAVRRRAYVAGVVEGTRYSIALGAVGGYYE